MYTPLQLRADVRRCARYVSVSCNERHTWLRIAWFLTFSELFARFEKSSLPFSTSRFHAFYPRNETDSYLGIVSVRGRRVKRCDKDVRCKIFIDCDDDFWYNGKRFRFVTITYIYNPSFSHIFTRTKWRGQRRSRGSRGYFAMWWQIIDFPADFESLIFTALRRRHRNVRNVRSIWLTTIAFMKTDKCYYDTCEQLYLRNALNYLRHLY